MWKKAPAGMAHIQHGTPIPLLPALVRSTNTVSIERVLNGTSSRLHQVNKHQHSHPTIFKVPSDFFAKWEEDGDGHRAFQETTAQIMP